MPKRVSFMMFLGIVSTIVFATGISAGAAPQDGTQAEQEEVASAQDRLSEIQTEASASYEAYNNALFQLNELDKEIDATARDLEVAKGNLAEAQASLEERASQVYRSGNVAFLDVLVGVDDFSEFASRLNLWLRLLGQERAEFEAVLEARNKLEREQSQLQDQRDQRASAVEDAAEQKSQADNAEAEAQAYLDSLNSELQAAIEEEQARQAEEARAAAEVAVEEAEPLAEIETVQVAQVRTTDSQSDLQAERELAEQRAAARAEQQAAAEAAAEEAERQAQFAERAAAKEKAAGRAAAEEARQAAEQAAIEQAAAELEAEQAAAQQVAEQQTIAEQQAATQQPQRQPVAQPDTNAGNEASQESAPVASSGGSASGSAVVAEAETWLGTPYVWGGTSRSGVDCSGLTMMVYAEFGVSLPRTTGEQIGVGTPVSSPAPGDLVFFGSGGNVTSVGIVTGPDTAIKATVPGDVVRYVSISEVGNAVGGVAGYRRVL